MLGLTEERLPLSLAAQRLKVSSERAKRMVTCGRLEGEFFAGRWMVTAESVARLATELADRADSVTQSLQTTKEPSAKERSRFPKAGL